MNFDVNFGMEYRGGGSVQADWTQNDPAAKDYVKNRPGGYTITDFDIAWDGNLDGHETIDAGNNTKLVRVSDAVLTQEQLTGATANQMRNGEMYEVASLTVMSQGDLIVLISDDEEIAVVALKTINIAGIVLTPGVYFYFSAQDGIVTYAARIAKSTIVKIPKEYFPFNSYVIDLYADDDGNLRARGFDADAFKQSVLDGGTTYLVEDGLRKQVIAEVDEPSASGLATQAVRSVARFYDVDGMAYDVHPTTDTNPDPTVRKNLRWQLPIAAGNGVEGWLAVKENAETGEYDVVFSFKK